MLSSDHKPAKAPVILLTTPMTVRTWPAEFICGSRYRFWKASSPTAKSSIFAIQKLTSLMSSLPILVELSVLAIRLIPPTATCRA